MVAHQNGFLSLFIFFLSSCFYFLSFFMFLFSFFLHVFIFFLSSCFYFLSFFMFYFLSSDSIFFSLEKEKKDFFVPCGNSSDTISCFPRKKEICITTRFLFIVHLLVLMLKTKIISLRCISDYQSCIKKSCFYQNNLTVFKISKKIKRTTKATFFLAEIPRIPSVSFHARRKFASQHVSCLSSICK